MKLLIQPEDGAKALVKEIDGAQKSIEIAIFRFDHADIERALERAVNRGVSVHALIANTNNGDPKNLRKLEMALLPAGIEVSRTSDDLLRHHYKFMLVDRRVLCLFAFNYTHLDIEHSRSFGLIIDDQDAVEEAERLFYADVRRQQYGPVLKSFVVSPVNAREQLSHFISAAEEQLLIYDPEISDRAMIRLLRDRARDGVEIRIIGRVVKPSREFGPARLMRMRFHTRTILRDRKEAFIGSQGLREAELDRRRELGMILRDREIVQSLVGVFESDWAGLERPLSEPRKVNGHNSKALKKAVKAMVRDMPLAPIVQSALKRAVGERPDSELQGMDLRHRLTDAVVEEIRDEVSRIVRKQTGVPH